MAVEVVEYDQDFLDFANSIKRKTGLDLLSYKQAQVRRRLTSLKNRKGFKTFAEFYRAIDREQAVYKAFMDQLTINVTEFYRNPARWQVLQTQVVPDIRQSRNRLKCWSAACSTGEEPYSLVLSMVNTIGIENIDVHATDIDAAVIDKAKAGRYSALSVKEVPPHELKRFFRHEAGEYILSEDIKGRVRFQRHNLLADPYEQGYDLIVCRNVAIYFTEEAKAQIYRRFAMSLNRGGYLFVGATEQIPNAEAYGLSSQAAFFYKKV